MGKALVVFYLLSVLVATTSHTSLSISCFFLLLGAGPFTCPLRQSFFLQLSATNVSARITMKGAANCDKHCELQISVNQ